LWLAALAPRARLGHMTGARLIGWLWAPAPWWWIAASIAAALCVACTVVTFVCWRKMGRSWRIGIDPNETLVMVTSGPYRMVRHPIYALRMVINVCVMVMAPTLLVVLAAGLDFVLLQIEARREERYMEATHGQAYARYKNSVGRFVPRTFVV
jgi:protein-S-isoprenylcysteine O-methyltransferase Ste14